MRDLIAHPFAWLLDGWHVVTGAVFGADGGVGWMLAVALVACTVRVVFVPWSVAVLESTRRHKLLATQIAQLKVEFADDAEQRAARVRLLMAQHRVNPLGPLAYVMVHGLVLLVTFVGVYLIVGRDAPNANMDQASSFWTARLFGVPISAVVGNPFAAGGDGGVLVLGAGVVGSAFLASYLRTRLRESVRPDKSTRQVNRLASYVFSLGVVVIAPFVSVAFLGYYLSCTLFDLTADWYIVRFHHEPSRR